MRSPCEYYNSNFLQIQLICSLKGKKAKARFMRFFSQKSGFIFQALKLETFFSGLAKR